MIAAGAAGGDAVGWDADPMIAWQHFPPLTGSTTADVCVVGLGGSGLAAIGELLGRGVTVVGLDAGRVAGGAAGRNGGFLLGGPAHAVHEAAALWGEEIAADFYRQTLAEIDHLEMLLGDDVIRRVGSLRIAGLPGAAPLPEGVDRGTELADCDVQFAFMSAHGLPVQRYDGDLGTGLYFPRDAAMNPVRRAMGLAALYSGQARLHERTAVTAIAPGRVVTPNGVVSAGAVVVAVDGGLEVLLPQLAGRVRTARLQMAATAPVPPGLVPCPVYARFGFDYLQQDAVGRIFAGGGRDRFGGGEWTMGSNTTAEVQGWIDVLIARIAGVGRIPPPRVTHRWAASVGYTPDSRPLVTEVDSRVVACGGYCGTGNLVGPLAARAAVALALDGTVPPPYFAA